MPLRLRTVPEHPICYTREPWLVGKSTAALKRLRGAVLVSSFYDPPLTAHRAERFERMGLRHWFAVQVHGVSNRITPMPLGVDRRDVAAMEAAPRLPCSERDIELYINLSPRYDERRQLLSQFARQQDWVTITGGRHMPEFFADLGRSQFVLSPRGRAWDCYRTYEAIAMGAVPIVRRTEPVSRVVDGLPVLVVDDWREVTRERLAAEYSRFADGHWDLSRITQAYWDARITGAFA